MSGNAANAAPPRSKRKPHANAAARLQSHETLAAELASNAKRVTVAVPT
jgi:hypothetical protein